MRQVASLRRFPRRAIPIRARGVRGIVSYFTGGNLFGPSEAVSGQPWYIPDAFYQLSSQAPPDTIYEINQANNAATAKAAINPVTKQVVPEAQAYADATEGAAGAAYAQGMTQSTGSPVADAFDNLFSKLTGSGNQITDPSSTFPWGTVILIGLLGVGGYVLVKVL